MLKKIQQRKEKWEKSVILLNVGKFRKRLRDKNGKLCDK